MSLEEILSEKNVPKWIQKSEIWKNWRDHDFSEGTDFHLYGEEIKTMDDFKNVWKAIQFWKIEPPCFYNFWEFVLNIDNRETVLEYLEHHTGECGQIVRAVKKPPHLLFMALMFGKLEKFKELLDLSFRLKDEEREFLMSNAFDLSAQNGQFEFLQYLNTYSENLKAQREVGINVYFARRACTSAAGKGQLECLKYLHANNFPWNHYTTLSAAGNGHLECLIYLHEQGCPWSEQTCKNAAKNGHLECLTYAVENDCPIEIQECLEVAKTEGIREYLLSLEN